MTLPDPGDIDHLARLRFERNVIKVHSLGPRVMSPYCAVLLIE